MQERVSAEACCRPSDVLGCVCVCARAMRLVWHFYGLSAATLLGAPDHGRGSGGRRGRTASAPAHRRRSSSDARSAGSANGRGGAGAGRCGDRHGGWAHGGWARVLSHGRKAAQRRWNQAVCVCQAFSSPSPSPASAPFHFTPGPPSLADIHGMIPSALCSCAGN